MTGRNLLGWAGPLVLPAFDEGERKGIFAIDTQLYAAFSFSLSPPRVVAAGACPLAP